MRGNRQHSCVVEAEFHNLINYTSTNGPQGTPDFHNSLIQAWQLTGSLSEKLILAMSHSTPRLRSGAPPAPGPQPITAPAAFPEVRRPQLHNHIHHFSLYGTKSPKNKLIPTLAIHSSLPVANPCPKNIVHYQTIAAPSRQSPVSFRTYAIHRSPRAKSVIPLDTQDANPLLHNTQISYIHHVVWTNCCVQIHPKRSASCLCTLTITGRAESPFQRFSRPRRHRTAEVPQS